MTSMGPTDQQVMDWWNEFDKRFDALKAEVARLTTERDEALADNKRLYWALADAKARAVQRAEKGEKR